MNQPRLILLSQPLRGQQFDLTEDLHAIGRSEQCGLMIDDPTVSGVHCELLRNDDGSYTARDTGSTNGTRVNGVRISEQKLVNSDILQIGGVEIMYDYEGQDTGADDPMSTRTNISIDGTGELRTDMQPLRPNWTSTHKAEENPQFKTAFTIFIGLLIFIVVVLLAVLGYMLFYPSPTPTP